MTEKIFLILRIFTVILLFSAIGRLPYDYYTILRFVVCGTSIYGAWIAFEKKSKEWTVIFIMIALLFNPIVPVRLKKNIWMVLDFAVGLIMLISVGLLRERRK